MILHIPDTLGTATWGHILSFEYIYLSLYIYIYIFLVYYKYLINIYVHRTNSVCLPAVFFFKLC